MTIQPTTETTYPSAGRGTPDRPRNGPLRPLSSPCPRPLAAGTLRLVQLAGGPALMPADHRFVGFPVPLVVHILGAAVYALVGRLPVRYRGSDAATGPGTAAPAGSWRSPVCVVAGSALWMTLFYEPQPGTGDLLYVLRLVFGSAMAGCLVLGFTAIRRRDIAAHRAWMIRAYAIGLGAGTQVFTDGIGGALFGNGEFPATSRRAPAGSSTWLWPSGRSAVPTGDLPVL